MKNPFPTQRSENIDEVTQKNGIFPLLTFFVLSAGYTANK